MRLLILCETFPPEVDAKASRFSEFVPEFIAKGLDVTLLTRCPNFPTGEAFEGFKNHWRRETALNGARVIRLWSYLSANAGFTKRIAGFVTFMLTAIWAGLRLKKIDVVLATSPSLFSAIGGFMIASLRRKAFIFEVRDLWPEAIITVGAMREGIIIKFFKWLAKLMYRRATHIVTVGEGYKQQIVDWYGISPDKISVIPNGILPEKFVVKRSMTQAREVLQLDPDTFYVLYLGTHGHAHSLHTALESAAQLKDENVVFLFVGEGAERARLIKQSEEMGLNNHCRFIGMITKDQVPLWYEASNAALVPLKSDPLFLGTVPSKIYEAMAMQRPVLCAVAGHASNIINTAKAGVSIAPEDADALTEAILQLSQNPEMAAQMGESGRAYVCEHYNRATLAARYCELLKSLGQ